MVSDEELVSLGIYLSFGFISLILLFFVWDMRPSNMLKSFGIPKRAGGSK
jgi:hypothetical protein